jgi:hypothetical protein
MGLENAPDELLLLLLLLLLDEVKFVDKRDPEPLPPNVFATLSSVTS